MISKTDRRSRIFSKRGILGGALVIAAIPAVAYASLVVASPFYDRSNPRTLPNSYHSIETVVVDRSVDDVFRFIQNDIPDVYTRLSPMHEKFEILNADSLVVGAEIDCVEGDHREVVREVIDNRLIAMSSTPTRVFERDTGKLTAEVNVYDYFDFEALGPKSTMLAQTVVLELKSPFTKAVLDLIAFVTFTRDDWERQCREQNRKLAAFAPEAS